MGVETHDISISCGTDQDLNEDSIPVFCFHKERRCHLLCGSEGYVLPNSQYIWVQDLICDIV